MSDNEAGVKVYRHPQGATITVHPDGTMDARRADGKRKQTSATPEKLAAGHGRWVLVRWNGVEVDRDGRPVT